MPRAALRPCTWPGCGALTESGRCSRHERAKVREYDQHRGSSNERLYGAAWQKVRADWLREHPLCQCPDCDEGRIRLREASVVDHKIPHRGNVALFWDRTNWQSMAKECHDSKTAREDGGFGRRVPIVQGGGR